MFYFEKVNWRFVGGEEKLIGFCWRWNGGNRHYVLSDAYTAWVIRPKDVR